MNKHILPKKWKVKFCLWQKEDSRLHWTNDNHGGNYQTLKRKTR